jgi:hypothetical protein
VRVVMVVAPVGDVPGSARLVVTSMLVRSHAWPGPVKSGAERSL